MKTVLRRRTVLSVLVPLALVLLIACGPLAFQAFVYPKTIIAQPNPTTPHFTAEVAENAEKPQRMPLGVIFPPIRAFTDGAKQEMSIRRLLCVRSALFANSAVKTIQRCRISPSGRFTLLTLLSGESVRVTARVRETANGTTVLEDVLQSSEDCESDVRRGRVVWTGDEEVQF